MKFLYYLGTLLYFTCTHSIICHKRCQPNQGVSIIGRVSKLTYFVFFTWDTVGHLKKKRCGNDVESECLICRTSFLQISTLGFRASQTLESQELTSTEEVLLLWLWILYRVLTVWDLPYPGTTAHEVVSVYICDTRRFFIDFIQYSRCQFRDNIRSYDLIASVSWMSWSSS